MKRRATLAYGTPMAVLRPVLSLTPTEALLARQALLDRTIALRREMGSRTPIHLREVHLLGELESLLRRLDAFVSGECWR